MKVKELLILFLIITVYNLAGQAQNPIVPPGIFVADPSAHSWDGKTLYVYGSRDLSPDFYCSWQYPVLSSQNLLDWTITENIFSSQGENDQVPYSDRYLYAPDCQYHNGKYYLYYCLATNQNTEGVATSNSPTGPFINGEVINTYGHNQIDPSVFIDDDGQAFYVWGQFTMKMAQLNPDMKSIDSTTLREAVITEDDHYFHEGAYMTKREGIYYLVYADLSRANRPTSIGYAMSKSPMGPYTYGGVIVDNDHCDPGVWNNHGSIAKFKDQWYVFYHRSTHGSNTMRKACVEPISFNADGTIDEVEMTSQGAAGPLPADMQIDAASACLLFGNVRIEANSSENEILTQIRNTDKAGYKYVNFGDGMETIEINVAAGADGGIIDIGLDQSWSPSIGRIEIPAGKNDGFITYSAQIKKTSGVNAVWLRFYGKKGEADFFEVDWFRFY